MAAGAEAAGDNPSPGSPAGRSVKNPLLFWSVFLPHGSSFSESFLPVASTGCPEFISCILKDIATGSSGENGQKPHA
jgi:hypothetical protein